MPRPAPRNWRLTPWSAEQKAAFLAMQFQAQHAHYQQYYPTADWLVAMRDGADIGRLYVDRWPSEHCVIDIALLPEHRGSGLGGALMRDLLDEAAAAGKAVSIHVEKFNPAMRLYRRLGFLAEEDKGVYDLMRWRARQAPQPSGEDRLIAVAAFERADRHQEDIDHAQRRVPYRIDRLRQPLPLRPREQQRERAAGPTAVAGELDLDELQCHDAIRRLHLEHGILVRREIIDMQLRQIDRGCHAVPLLTAAL